MKIEKISFDFTIKMLNVNKYLSTLHPNNRLNE
jgi:hypothetical protein